MAGVTENLNVRVTLTLEKKQRLKWCVGGNNFPLSNCRTAIKRLLRDYQATFPLCHGNFILTATVTASKPWLVGGMCFWASLGLGMLDVSRTRDLGLPAIGMELGLADPKGSESKAVAAEDGPESDVVQKFQLGETLPVVSARMVHRILKGDFTDMAELSEEHLEFELR